MSPMRTVFTAVAVMAAVALVSAQRVGQKIRGTETRKPLPVRLGPDGRPLLFAPKINMCQNSKWNKNAVSWRFKPKQTDIFLTSQLE